MARIEWNDAIIIGFAKIDEQHRMLVDIYNELNDAVEVGRDREVLGALIERLIQYTRQHFQYEEALLSSTKYPGASDHGTEHDDMINTVLTAQARFRWGNSPHLGPELLSFLQSWLLHHIQGTDREYIEHLRQHGIQ